MKEQLVQCICDRLTELEDQCRSDFESSVKQVGVRYVVVDDLLPLDIAEKIHAAFPPSEQMRLMRSFRECKYTSKSFEKFDPLLGDITFAIQDPRVVAVVERITGIKEQVPDQHLYAGGLSAMSQGHYLGPHIDNSHDGSRTYYRTLNLLYYVSKDWKETYGGNLELWDQRVKRSITIPSLFNRLVIMETNPWSWHSVSQVSKDGRRCCVSNYYFSKSSPIGRDYSNVTTFSARPEQPWLRALGWMDGKLRETVRIAVPQGLGRKDVYEGPPR